MEEDIILPIKKVIKENSNLLYYNVDKINCDGMFQRNTITKNVHIQNYVHSSRSFFRLFSTNIKINVDNKIRIKFYVNDNNKVLNILKQAMNVITVLVVATVLLCLEDVDNEDDNFQSLIFLVPDNDNEADVCLKNVRVITLQDIVCRNISLCQKTDFYFDVYFESFFF